MVSKVQIPQTSSWRQVSSPNCKSWSSSRGFYSRRHHQLSLQEQWGQWRAEEQLKLMDFAIWIWATAGDGKQPRSAMELRVHMVPLLTQIEWGAALNFGLSFPSTHLGCAGTGSSWGLLGFRELTMHRFFWSSQSLPQQAQHYITEPASMPRAAPGLFIPGF